jgi:hypothetical protein
MPTFTNVELTDMVFPYGAAGATVPGTVSTQFHPRTEDRGRNDRTLKLKVLCTFFRHNSEFSVSVKFLAG